MYRYVLYNRNLLLNVFFFFLAMQMLVSNTHIQLANVNVK